MLGVEESQTEQEEQSYKIGQDFWGLDEDQDSGLGAARRGDSSLFCSGADLSQNVR